jgi:replicative DNA helicase
MVDVANEQAVVTSMMNDVECCEKGLLDVEIEDFCDSTCRRIFASMQFLQRANTPIDFISVSGMFHGEDEMVVNIFSSFFLPSSFDSYVLKLKQDRKIRNFITGMSKCIQEATDENPICFENAQSLLDELATIGTVEIKPVGDSVDLAINDMGEVKSGIPTGYPKLDRYTSGLCKGNLVVVAGRPGSGKSSFAMNVATNVAKNGKVVAVFSLEMQTAENIKRILYGLSKASAEQVRKQDNAAVERILQSAEIVRPMKMFIDDKGTATVQKIQSACYRIKKQEKGLDLVVIDYLQLMKTTQKKNGTRQQEIGELTRGLKLMANEMQTTVMLLSQLNRECEKREDKRPVITDLRESGDIEQDADIVLFTYRPSMYREDAQEYEASILIAKNRNGVPNGEVDLHWRGEWFLFENPATEQDMQNIPKEWR